MQLRLFYLALLTMICSRFFLWVHVNPMFQGPDEVQHLAMSAQLDRTTFDIYKTTPPLWLKFEESFDYKSDYYKQKGVVAKYEVKPTYAEDGVWGIQELELLHTTGFESELSKDNYRHLTYAYPPLYYFIIGKLGGLYRQFGEGRLIDYQFILRLSGLPIFLLFMFLLVKLTSEYLQSPYREICILLVAMHPMLTFMTSIVNNDNILLPLTLAILWSSVKILKGQTRWHLLYAISVAALSFSKSQGIMIAVIVTALMGGWHLLDRRWGLAFVDGLLICLTIGLYFLGQSLFGPTVLTGIPSPILFGKFMERFFSYELKHLVFSTVGQFGWGEVTLTKSVYVVLAIMFFSVLLWTGRVLYRRVSQWKEKSFLTKAHLYLFYVGYVFAILTLQYLMMPKLGFITQGRYALSALPVVYILGAVAVVDGFSHSKGMILRYGVVGSLWLWTILSFDSLRRVIKRFYFDSDVSIDAVYERIFQYKPLYFKNQIIFFTVLALFVLSQLYLTSMASKKALQKI